MLHEHHAAVEVKGGKVAVQEKEFILGGQFNEDGTTRLEVALLASEGTTKLELRLLGYGEGIGWYVQRRIHLDPLQIGALKAILGRGAGRVKSSAPNMAITDPVRRLERKSPQGLSLSLCS